MTAAHRHSTDRKDWTIIVECPYNGRPGPIIVEREMEMDFDDPPDDCEHLTLEAEATNADMDPREMFPIEECPVCGAELTIISKTEPTEVLK